RRGGNFGHAGGLLRLDALGIGQVDRGSDARGCRIAWVLKHVLYGAALHASRWAIGALGINIALEVTFVDGIRVDDHAGGAFFFGDKTFYPAEVPPVAHDYDFSTDIDAHFLKLL